MKPSNALPPVWMNKAAFTQLSLKMASRCPRRRRGGDVGADVDGEPGVQGSGDELHHLPHDVPGDDSPPPPRQP